MMIPSFDKDEFITHQIKMATYIAKSGKKTTLKYLHDTKEAAVSCTGVKIGSIYLLQHIVRKLHFDKKKRRSVSEAGEPPL